MEDGELTTRPLVEAPVINANYAPMLITTLPDMKNEVTPMTPKCLNTIKLNLKDKTLGYVNEDFEIRASQIKESDKLNKTELNKNFAVKGQSGPIRVQNLMIENIGGARQADAAKENGGKAEDEGQSQGDLRAASFPEPLAHNQQGEATYKETQEQQCFAQNSLQTSGKKEQRRRKVNLAEDWKTNLARSTSLQNFLWNNWAYELNNLEQDQDKVRRFPLLGKEAARAKLLMLGPCAESGQEFYEKEQKQAQIEKTIEEKEVVANVHENAGVQTANSGLTAGTVYYNLEENDPKIQEMGNKNELQMEFVPKEKGDLKLSELSTESENTQVADAETAAWKKAKSYGRCVILEYILELRRKRRLEERAKEYENLGETSWLYEASTICPESLNASENHLHNFANMHEQQQKIEIETNCSSENSKEAQRQEMLMMALEKSIRPWGRVGSQWDMRVPWWRAAHHSTGMEVLNWVAVAKGMAGCVWTTPIAIHHVQVQALLDTGASRSFIAPSLVEEAKLKDTGLLQSVKFRTASGNDFEVKRVVKDMGFTAGTLCTKHDFLIAQTPYRIILGADWMYKEGAVWCFVKRTLTIKRGHVVHVIQCESHGSENAEHENSKKENFESKEDQAAAAQAHKQMVADLAKLSEDQAKVMVRSPPRRYKNYRNKNKLIPIKTMLRDIKLKQENGEVNVYEQLHLIDVGESLEERDEHSEKECNSSENSDSECESLDEKEMANWSKAKGWELSMQPAELPTHCKFENWLQEHGAACPAPIRQVLVKHRELFLDQLPPGLPPQRVIDHTITLVPGKMPSKGAVYRLTKEQLEVQRTILQNLKNAKWITLTSSPFAAPAMLVDKKDDAAGNKQYRMVINYKELNAITISPEYPLPTIQEVLDMLHGAKVFTTMDMEQGFHQIRVAPEDQYKTAFRTCMGQYEFKVMPFGLRGAPGTFQAVMNHMFLSYLGRGVIIYLDDVLVYSSDVQSHAALLNEVLDILNKNKMYPKLSKCQFGKDSIEYLGYVVSSSGITPSRDKVHAVDTWPEVLHNDTHVRQFLGTVNYCRMFMGPGFADMARCLVELTKKNVPFKWTEKHTAAVKALKHALCNYTVLQMPDPSKPYVLKTDASAYAVGGVLEQEGKPLGFMSIKMSDVERRYAVYDQELLALIRALEKWRTLLLTADVTAYTDHRGLEYLLEIKSNKQVKPRIARWLEFLADFQKLKIVYKPGASNVVADALSRNPFYVPEEDTDSRWKQLITQQLQLMSEVELQKIARGTLKYNNSSGYYKHPVPAVQISADKDSRMRIGDKYWLAALERCKYFAIPTARARLAEPKTTTRSLLGKDYEFKMLGNLLMININGAWRVCVPDNAQCKQHVMYNVHDHPTAGHMGVRKTYVMLARQFYWPKMAAYSKEYVESCIRCRMAKTVSRKPAGLLQSLQIPSRRWEQVSLDFIVGLPLTPKGNDAILTLVDSLSKMAHFVPTRSTATAEDTIELLADRLVRYHGLPRVLVSDRDVRFVSEIWRRFCEKFKIKQAMSSAWHPQTDGQTERVHRTLEQILRTYIQHDEAQWELLLPAVELAYNCTVHSSTGMTPFEVMIGENPLRAVDLELEQELQPTSSPPMTKIFCQLVDRAAVHIREAQAAQKFYADKNRREEEFEVGDFVWVSTRYMQPRGCAKFQPKFVGPFKVLKRVGKVAYRLALPPSMKQHPVFHVALLLRDKPRPNHMGEQECWDPIAGSECDEYEVEYLLDRRGTGPDEEFLVKWRGFPAEQATWEPVENLANSRDLVKAFRQNEAKQRRKGQLRPSTLSRKCDEKD